MATGCLAILDEAIAVGKNTSERREGATGAIAVPRGEVVLLVMSDDDAAEAMRASDLFAQILSKALNLHLVTELSEHQVSVAQMQALRYV